MLRRRCNGCDSRSFRESRRGPVSRSRIAHAMRPLCPSGIGILATAANASHYAVNAGVFLIKAEPRVRSANVDCGRLVVTYRCRPRHRCRFVSGSPRANRRRSIGDTNDGYVSLLMSCRSNSSVRVGEMENVRMRLLPDHLCGYGNSHHRRQNCGHARETFNHWGSSSGSHLLAGACAQQTAARFEIFPVPR